METSRYESLRRFLDLSNQINQVACGLARATLDGNPNVTKTYAEAILQMTSEQEKLTVELQKYTK